MKYHSEGSQISQDCRSWESIICVENILDQNIVATAECAQSETTCTSDIIIIGTFIMVDLEARTFTIPSSAKLKTS